MVTLEQGIGEFNNTLEKRLPRIPEGVRLSFQAAAILALIVLNPGNFTPSGNWKNVTDLADRFNPPISNDVAEMLLRLKSYPELYNDHIIDLKREFEANLNKLEGESKAETFRPRLSQEQINAKHDELSLKNPMEYKSMSYGKGEPPPSDGDGQGDSRGARK